MAEKCFSSTCLFFIFLFYLTSLKWFSFCCLSQNSSFYFKYNSVNCCSAPCTLVFTYTCIVGIEQNAVWKKQTCTLGFKYFEGKLMIFSVSCTKLVFQDTKFQHFSGGHMSSLPPPFFIFHPHSTTTFWGSHLQYIILLKALFVWGIPIQLDNIIGFSLESVFTIKYNCTCNVCYYCKVFFLI